MNHSLGLHFRAGSLGDKYEVSVMWKAHSLLQSLNSVRNALASAGKLPNRCWPSPHLPSPLLWSKDRKMQHTERLLVTEVTTFYFSQSSKVDDLSANYAAAKIKSSCEVILQHGNLFHEKPNGKGLWFACSHNPMYTQEKICGIHKKKKKN